MKKRILTGDRPTGPLHLGHLVGSLENRVKLQDEYDCFFIIADYQVLTDRLETSEIEDNIIQIILDYLAVGIDPKKSVIFIQSKIPQLAELTMLFSMLVSVARVRRNPTVKSEVKSAKLKNISLGMLSYPVSQAADILLFKGSLVPVGEDQLPHLEQTREIARTFNKLYGRVFPIPEPLLGRNPKLAGLDGSPKMSKSRGNAVFLSDSREEIERKVKKAITDPQKVRMGDAGHPKVCPIYTYQTLFSKEHLSQITKDCQSGKLGCVACKKILIESLDKLLSPMRKKRERLSQDISYIRSVINNGTERALQEGEKTLTEVKKAMRLDYSQLGC